MVDHEHSPAQEENRHRCPRCNYPDPPSSMTEEDPFLTVEEAIGASNKKLESLEGEVKALRAKLEGLEKTGK